MGQKTISGADLICRALLAEDVEVLFGHPGGAILPFYDALHRTPELRHVLMRHEQAAAHAADGYARKTRRTGVCVTTSGPGATNLVTGLATAMMDSVPLVAITGQVATWALGTQAFQETDIIGVSKPVTKQGFMVHDAADIPQIIAEAFRIASSGRPGPVLIDLPKDVQTSEVPPVSLPSPRADSTWAASVCREGGATPAARAWRQGELEASVQDFMAHQLDEVARMLDEARRPVLMLGRGIVLAGVERIAGMMAERCDLPVSTTLLGLDAFPAEHRLACGMPGMHGTPRANLGIQESDLILGLGLRFDDRVIGDPSRFAPNARIVHFDVDPAAFGRTIQPDMSVIGDLRVTLPELARRAKPASRPEWWALLESWSREAEPRTVAEAQDDALGGREAIRSIARRISSENAVVACDVGQHQMWLAQELPNVSPRAYLTSGGLGAMGYALPAAIGAAIAEPGRPVWVVAGDGGFQMNMQELATVVQEQLPLRIAVLNNGFLGMVRQWQQAFHGGRYSGVELGGPDFGALAAAYGIPGVAIDRSAELEDTLDRAAETSGPVLVDLRVEKEENVYPFVPSGAALDELLTAAASS